MSFANLTPARTLRECRTGRPRARSSCQAGIFPKCVVHIIASITSGTGDRYALNSEPVRSHLSRPLKDWSV
jgi:hypothetical protein